MISIVITCPLLPGEPLGTLGEIYEWLGKNVIDHWAVERLTLDKIKVDFFGVDQEQDVVAFKLKFRR